MRQQFFCSRPRVDLRATFTDMASLAQTGPSKVLDVRVASKSHGAFPYSEKLASLFEKRTQQYFEANP
jgi:hypothetical protein